MAEICNLHSQDVDFIGKSVKLYGKGSKERIIPIENTSVLTILSDYYFIYAEKSRTADIFCKQIWQKADRAIRPLYD